MNVNYYVIVEKDEYDDYKKIIDEKKLLILPQKYKKIMILSGKMMTLEQDRVRLVISLGNIL